MRRFLHRLRMIINPPSAADDRWYAPTNVPVPQGLEQPIHESWFYRLPEQYRD